MSRKQQLLKRHRRNKRISLVIGLLLLIASGVLVAWWLPEPPAQPQRLPWRMES